MGLMSQETISGEDQTKAKTKATKSLRDKIINLVIKLHIKSSLKPLEHGNL